MSSLAAQLAAGASLNAALLTDRSRRKATESYLFTGRDADQHDLESIHALALNGLIQLAMLNPAFKKFEAPLFSSAAKSTDRTLLPSDAVAKLDTSISSFLLLLGPHLLDAPTTKVLEWLVRRFRIHEFNLEATLSLFLPYHESPHFAKMITILHIKPNSTWSFLLPFKSAAQSVPRSSLVTEMLQNTDVSRFVTSLLPTAIKAGYSHRCLLAFNAATLHEFILRSKSLDEGTLAYILPALLEPLQNRSDAAIKEAILGSYILFAALSQRCQFTPLALQSIVTAMSNCARRVDVKQFLSAVVSVCEPQPEMEELGGNVVKTILKLPNIVDELGEAWIWTGTEKFVGPMLGATTQRLTEDIPVALLENIINSKNSPKTLVKRTASILCRLAVQESSVTPARALVSSIRQRHPAIFSQVADELSASGESTTEQVDQLVLALSMGTILGPADSPDMVLASNNADEKVRVIAVKDLVASLSSNSLSAAEIQSVETSLLFRVRDSQPKVLEALYEKPALIGPVMIKNVDVCTEGMSSSLASSSTSSGKTKRAIIRHQLPFFLSHVWPHVDHSAHEKFYHKVLFPLMLYSKARHHTVDLVWEIIAKYFSPLGGITFELLDGCAEIWKTSKDKISESDTAENGVHFNDLFSSKIAENILASNGFVAHLDMLLLQFHDLDHFIHILAGLIARGLLGRLSGEHQLNVAHKVLDNLDLEELALAQLTLDDNVSDEAAMFADIFAKPSSKNTITLLRISLVATTLTTPSPAITLDWVTASVSSSNDQRGRRYVALMRRIYEFVTSSSSPVILNLLRDLFVKLNTDSLAFLSAFWTTFQDPDVAAGSLQHALAFLQAHDLPAEHGADGVDFQTILPAFLVALTSPEPRQRELASQCIVLLDKQAKSRKFVRVYAFDVIYGDNEMFPLQYLSQEETSCYLGSLVDDLAHFAHDPQYLESFHLEHLGKVKTDKKKDIEYKTHVLCFLLSHINAQPLSRAPLVLLRSIRSLSESTKAHMLLPRIEELVTGKFGNTTEGSLLEDFEILAISTFDLSVTKDLNGKDSTLWPVFCSMLRYCLRPGHSVRSRTMMSKSLQHGVFLNLNLDHKGEACEIILHIGSRDPDEHDFCARLLTDLLTEISLIVRLLDSVQPDVVDESQRASKKAKVADATDSVLPRLSLLAEVLGSKSLLGSVDLLARLLETLSKVIQTTSPGQADVAYVEQLLMSAIDNVASKVETAPNVAPSVIRLDILVDLLRGTDNPQTFNQALILLANLARLSPDSVLRNIMPVFTFMGSNVFHRDDAYSFTVVQKTIDSIVPVMVSSLRAKYSSRLDLFIGARDFLRVFTDAANHIPRHRRTSFFVHLVDVLGAEDFLAPVCLLLVQKTANRVVRQNVQDAQSSFALPTNVLHHYASSMVTATHSEVLQETQRLVAHMIAQNPEPTFLDDCLFEEHGPSPTAVFKRRIQALIMFVGSTIQPPATSKALASDATSDVLSGLISLAGIQRTSQSADLGDVATAARSALNRALTVVAASDFIGAVLSMIRSNGVQVQAGALELLGDRLPRVSDKVRREISPSVITITETIRMLLTAQPEETIFSGAFKALTAIAMTGCSGEENSMIAVIPLVLAAVRSRKSSTSAMAVLAALPAKLGPRLLPFFREIVTDCVAILREGVAEWIDDASATLSSLLISIPTFWGTTELTQILSLCFELHGSKSTKAESTVGPLMKAVSKRVPSKVLLSTMSDMWPLVQQSRTARQVAYFILLRRSLRVATRSAIEESLRAIFQVFLGAFEVFTSLAPESQEAEAQAIASFVELVVKLNETTFKPLFRRLYDWGFASDGVAQGDIGRKIVFCNVYMALLDHFKALMNPYMVHLLQPFVDTLKAYSKSTLDDVSFWVCILKTLSKSLACDEGSYWRDDKLQLITKSIVAQLVVRVRIGAPAGDLEECLNALTECATNDLLLKSINLDILMHTRSEDARLRLFALTCSEMLWRNHGGKLLGFAAETATFIAESTEDENENCIREAFKLKDAVESVAGSINL
ncbi:hypothetical protein C8J56DRAFT_230499 [Mycena floridula]|nr:hypothetical protein C8J56DRAFT_230499 [Mycena floridula]